MEPYRLSSVVGALPREPIALVDSAEGAGTTCRIRLPVVPD